MIKTLTIALITLSTTVVKAKNTINWKTEPFLQTTTDSLKLDSLIKKQVFKLSNNQFSGEGWTKLTGQIQKAHFVMIGEDHGLAEIPIFSAHVARILQPAALVAEIDPYTALELKKISVKPDTYSSYFKQHPYALSFYSYRTEMDLAREMQQSQIDIWGLNEINFLSLDRFFITLSENAKSAAHKKRALDKAAFYAKTDRPFFYDVTKLSSFSAYQMKASMVDSLIEEFSNENVRCKEMLNNLKMSLSIFPNNKPQFRVNLMKKNLVNYLAPYLKDYSIPLPKLLFKFGANHVTRSNDATSLYEVGSLADNLVEAAGKTSLHILITCKKGTINQMAPVDNNKAIIPYDIAENGLTGFKQFSDQVKEDEWALFDLKPIRRALITGKLSLKNGQLKEFIMGYDLLVISGKATGNLFID